MSNTSTERLVCPEPIGPANAVASERKRLTNSRLNDYLQCFQDRLSETKWSDRCQLVGARHFEEARRQGRGVVLAFCHFGPYSHLRIWLRALGISSTILIHPRSERRPRWQQFLDRQTSQTPHPTRILVGELRQAAAVLASGDTLLIAVDARRGKQITVPVEPGWVFQMATGALRMAARHEAALIPCCITDEGRWRCHIELCAPVPAELLESESRWPEAGRDLLDKLLPRFKANPDQSEPNLTTSFKQISQSESNV